MTKRKISMGMTKEKKPGNDRRECESPRGTGKETCRGKQERKELLSRQNKRTAYCSAVKDSRRHMGGLRRHFSFFTGGQNHQRRLQKFYRNIALNFSEHQARLGFQLPAVMFGRRILNIGRRRIERIYPILFAHRFGKQNRCAKRIG